MVVQGFVPHAEPVVSRLVRWVIEMCISPLAATLNMRNLTLTRQGVSWVLCLSRLLRPLPAKETRVDRLHHLVSSRPLVGILSVRLSKRRSYQRSLLGVTHSTVHLLRWIIRRGSRTFSTT